MMHPANDSTGDPACATTLPRLIRACAVAYGEAIAVTLRDEDMPEESLSFAALDRRSADIARGLIARGAGKGMRIGFLFGNGPGFALMLAAIARIGAVAIPISTMIRADELVRVLRQSDVAGLIVQRHFLGHDLVERLGDALPALRGAGGGDLRIARAPYLRWIVSDGDGLPAFAGTLAALVRAGGAVDGAVGGDLLRAIEAEVHPTDQMLEIYTSGSMALPKGVKHDHGAVLFRARDLAGLIGLRRGQEAAAYLPMFWVGGLMMSLLPNLAAGATTTCTSRTLSDSRLSIGGVLGAEELARMARAPRPWWGLGMSETLGPYAWGDEFRAPGHPVCAPMDHIADGYEVRVVDAAGRPVADGIVGEIQIRGRAVTPGLHKIAREDHFTPDGFYRTGDTGIREGHRLHFAGRDGDVIKTAGSNVSPAEVEGEMQRLPGVQSAYVVGLPDRERGELVAAAVVPREGTEPDFAEMAALLRKRLSPYKVPRAFVAITREEVPLLHSNKVARRQVRDLLAARLGRDG